MMLRVKFNSGNQEKVYNFSAKVIDSAHLNGKWMIGFRLGFMWLHRSVNCQCQVESADSAAVRRLEANTLVNILKYYPIA